MRLACPLIILLVVIPGLTRADDAPSGKQISEAVAKALPLIQKGAKGSAAQRDCFTCHNQALPMLAMKTAQERGFAIEQTIWEEQVLHTATFLSKNRERYNKGIGQGGQADTAGYALWALELAGWEPDATTGAVAEYLLRRDREKEYWKTTSFRPPSEASHFTVSYLALRGLQRFGTSQQHERVAARVGLVRDWLRETKAKDNEDRVFRMWALKVAGAEDEEVAAAAADLLKTQRTDGGWSQTDDLKSDAYATGSALVALVETGQLKTEDSAYRRGLRFLIGDQKDDGSWHVVSRSKPFQIYYESGFPHKNDQFISLAASSWATTALARACSKK